MRRWLLAAMFCILGSGSAWAQCAAYPFTLANGTVADANQVMANFNTVQACAQSGALLQANNNAAVQILTTTNVSNGVVNRLGFATKGDAPAQIYLAENGTCAANSRINDGGSCINTTSGDGNSFYAVFPAAGRDPREWGAKGTCGADDTAPLQAAITASTNQTVLLEQCYSISSGLTITSPVKLSGGDPKLYAGWPAAGAAAPCNTGIRVATANLAGVLIFSAGASGSTIWGLCIDNANITNTSGSTISAIATSGTNLNNIAVIRTQIIGCFICVDLSGTGAATQNIGARIEDDTFMPVDQAGAIAIRVGHNDAGGNNNAITTQIYINKTDIYCNGAIATNSTAIRLEDAGGAFVRNTNSVACNLGLVIFPGANQNVTGSVLTDNSFDSDRTADMYIDTGASTSLINLNQFTSNWFASSLTVPALIENNGGGTVAGLHFSANRFYPRNNTDAITLANMVNGGKGSDITFKDNTVCWTSTGTSAGTAIDVQGTVALALTLDVIGNTLGGCDTNGAPVGGMAVGLTLASSSTSANVIANRFNNTTTPINLAGTTILAVGFNAGINDQNTQSVASAGTTTISVNNPTIFVSGAATIATITPAWPGRTLTLIPTGAWTTTVVGGNIGTAFTATPGKAVTAIYNGTNWNFGGY